MSNNYSQHFTLKATPQTQPIPGKPMVPNSAGGFVFAVDKWVQLHRFLVLGSEGGTYYVKEQKLTQDNCQNVIACIKADGRRAVDMIVEISDAGRAPKNDAAIFALALACTVGDQETKQLAYGSIKKVCRIGTHIFQFCEAIKALRKWSRGLRTGVAGFYHARKTDDVIYQLIKYRQRNGWTHKDVLRLAHVKAPTPELNTAFKWVVGKDVALDDIPERILAFQVVQDEKLQPEVVAAVMQKHQLPWEALPTARHKDPVIWAALVQDMGLTALMRNLGRFAAIGLTKSNLDQTSRAIAERIKNPYLIGKSRAHPLAILTALRTYAQGHGDKGSMTWTPVSCILDALDEAFQMSFHAVTPTGKNMLLALDVSGSMGSTIAGSPLSAREASLAMALVTARTEKHTDFACFSNRMMPFTVQPKDSLASLVKRMSDMDFDGTDCSLPMIYALEQELKVDTFVVYTDSETYAGHIQPVQALNNYRQATGIAAKLIVVGMTSSGFTIADPSDAGMLDVVGFDTATPNVISQFAAE